MVEENQLPSLCSDSLLFSSILLEMYKKRRKKSLFRKYPNHTLVKGSQIEYKLYLRWLKIKANCKLCVFFLFLFCFSLTFIMFLHCRESWCQRRQKRRTNSSTEDAQSAESQCRTWL